MNDEIQSRGESSSSERVSIRQATAADSDLLISLIISLAEFEKLTPPDGDAQKRLVADAFGAKPRFDVFLAEVGGTVSGYAFVFETYSTFLALPTLYLEDLFVKPEYRGQRIGLALMRFLANETLRRGCGRLEWAVLDWNTNAIRFYDRLGASHLSEWLHYRLDQEGLRSLSTKLP